MASEIEKPEKSGWEHGELRSLDRFADIVVRYADDNDGFLIALGDEYHVKGGMGAVAAFRGILATIADEVADEVRKGSAASE